jgi:hypothetical protein
MSGHEQPSPRPSLKILGLSLQVLARWPGWAWVAQKRKIVKWANPMAQALVVFGRARLGPSFCTSGFFPDWPEGCPGRYRYGNG